VTLAAETRLGPYEIIAPLGAGGMGEMYRARDTRLDRTVAIKVLPSHLSSDTVRRRRFERDARAISHEVFRVDRCSNPPQCVIPENTRRQNTQRFN